MIKILLKYIITDNAINYLFNNINRNFLQPKHSQYLIDRLANLYTFNRLAFSDIIDKKHYHIIYNNGCIIDCKTNNNEMWYCIEYNSKYTINMTNDTTSTITEASLQLGGLIWEKASNIYEIVE